MREELLKRLKVLQGRLTDIEVANIAAQLERKFATIDNYLRCVKGKSEDLDLIVKIVDAGESIIANRPKI